MDRQQYNPTALFAQNRHLLILTITMLLVAGLAALSTLPRIEDPRITTRNATIVTPFAGASANRVEALVTKKIEDRLRELSEIKNIESTSRFGVSVISLELEDWVSEADNEQIFAKIRDRLDDAADELPPGAAASVFDDKRGAVAYSMIVSLSWQGDAPTQLGILNRLAEQLGDRLRNLPGTGQIVFFGTPHEEIQVNVDAAELAALGMTPDELARRVAAADARVSAGTLHEGRRSLALELTGALDSAIRVAEIPLADNGRGGLLTVGDIAQVRKQWQDPPQQIALHDGARALLVAVRTERDVRLDQWAVDARQVIQAFGAQLDPAVSLETVFDQSRYTESRLTNLAGNLVAGAAVIMVVVLLMMGWRPALIVGSALPLAAAATLFGLTFFDEQIHQMSIFGMIIAIGLLIDNAIVMTENVVSRRQAGAGIEEAVSGAIRHLFTPLLASTLTTVLGFMPIFLLPGNVGDFVGPIAIAVVLALIASFLLSMSVIPALASLFATTRSVDPHWWRVGVRTPTLSHGFRRVLRAALRRPMLAIGLTAVLPVTGLVLAGSLGIQFFPPADRDQLELQVWMPAGGSIKHTAARLRTIDQHLEGYVGINGVTWVAGASSPPVYYNQMRDQDDNPTYARGVVRVVDAITARRLETTLQHDLTARFRDAQIVVKAFGQGPPVKAPVGLRIVGHDPNRLRLLGQQVRGLLQQHPAVTHTQASILGGEPKLWVEADERQASYAGLSLRDVADQFRAALDGRVGGRVLEDLEDLPVRIRYAAPARTSLDEVGSLKLRVAGDERWMPALSLGELELRPALGSVTRRNGERINEINAFLHQGALPIEVTRDVMARIEAGALSLPPGYRIELGGDSAEQQRAMGQLLTYAPVLAILMIGTLVLSFRSFALAGLIGIVAVFSLGLGMLALWAGGYPLGFNPIIGSAGLIGVAINGAIVVLAAIRANPRARAGHSGAIITETMGATRHILSTTLTTVAGFMPLLLFTGGDFWPPLAVVIAGGVGLSGLLSLFLAPAAYKVLRGRRAFRQTAFKTSPAAA